MVCIIKYYTVLSLDDEDNDVYKLYYCIIQFFNSNSNNIDNNELIIIIITLN